MSAREYARTHAVPGNRPITFVKATTPAEREAINTFLTRHNTRGPGSSKGFVAYYAAVEAEIESAEGQRPLVDRIAAAAKFCPLHTPQAGRFFAGEDWRHVYCLQRLAASGYRCPKNLLSRFLAWCLDDMGKDARVWYVATYADSGSFDVRTGRPHDGGIYRATNAVYCGTTKPGRVEGFIRDGKRQSMRCGPRTYTLADLESINQQARLSDRPEPIKVLRARAMHRYVWPVGSTRALRRARRAVLESRMVQYHFEPIWQPRLLARLRKALEWIERLRVWASAPAVATGGHTRC